MAQVKDRARMDLAERRIPQDGGFQVDYAGKLIDLRVATIPAVDGELIVLRVLDPDRVQPSLAGLGITRIDHWRSGFQRQHGLRSEEHTSELQSLMRTSYAVFCLKKKQHKTYN